MYLCPAQHVLCAVRRGDMREQALISGKVVLHASAAMASRRVNKGSDNGHSDDRDDFGPSDSSRASVDPAQVEALQAIQAPEYAEDTDYKK